MNLLYIALGGAMGSVARYLLSGTALQWTTGSFPLGTFLVNILGALCIGIVWGHYQQLQEGLRLLIITGFLGGFTTFSTFSLEGLQLFQSGNHRIGLLYVVGSLLLGLAAVFAGLKISDAI